MELPNYSTKPSISKRLVPRIVFVVLLAALLYTGIIVNLSIFEKNIPIVLNYVLIATIVIISFTEIIIAYVSAGKNKIYFFDDRIEKRGKRSTTIILNPNISIEIKKSVLDNIFNTARLEFNTGQSIEDMKYPEKIRDYVMHVVGPQSLNSQKIRKLS